MAGWNPTLANVITVCIRLQEYRKDVTSTLSDIYRKEDQDDDREKVVGDEVEKSEFSSEQEFGFKSSFNIECERNKTVLALKERIFDVTGYSAESQKLLYIGR